MVDYPIEVKKNKQGHFYLQRGRETFRDDEGNQFIWNNPDDAYDWAIMEHPGTAVIEYVEL